MTHSTPTLFVAGATGYTGRALVQVACARGLRTLAHVRPGSPRAAALKPQLTAWGAEVVEVPWQREALVDALAQDGVSHVFSLLGITAAGARREHASRGGTRPTYDSVDRDLTLLLHSACAEVAPPPRFVYLSSLGADGSWASASPYMAARVAVEKALRESSVPWLSVRPAFISGPDRDEARAAERVGAVVADGVLGLLGALGATTVRDRYATVTGAELAALLVDAGLGNRESLAVDLADLRQAT